MSNSQFEQKLALWQDDPRFIEIAGRNSSWDKVIAQYGLAVYQAGETETAVAAFRLACEQAPREKFNWSNLGVALSDLGRNAEAAAMLQRSLVLDPNQTVVQFNLAEVEARLGHFSAAQAAYIRAGENPELAQEALLGAGLMYLRHLEYPQAADAFREAIARFPHLSQAHANLGLALFQSGDLARAAAAYRQAYQLEKIAGYQKNLSFINLLENFIQNKSEAALTAFQAADPDSGIADILRRAVFFLTTYRHFAAAKQAAQLWVARAPQDPEAAYSLAAVNSEQLPRAPADYLQHHFDDVAGNFDQALLTHLHYAVPEQLAQLFGRHLGTGWQGAVLDAGCGPGLLAERLRPLATHLVGLDISPAMLDLARPRQLYDTLLQGDLAELPALTDEIFDLIVATDVLIYFGDLEAAFRALAERLQPGGWLAINLELMPGNKYFLMPNGRFKHARNYLEQIRRTHFSVIEMVEAPIRSEAGYPVPGTILLLKKRA